MIFSFEKPYRKKAFIWSITASVFSLLPLWSLLIYRLASDKTLCFDIISCTLVVSYSATLSTSVLLDYHFGSIKTQNKIASRSESNTEAPLVYVFVPFLIILFCALVMTTAVAVEMSESDLNLPIVICSSVLGVLSFFHAYYAKKLQFKTLWKEENFIRNQSQITQQIHTDRQSPSLRSGDCG